MGEAPSITTSTRLSQWAIHIPLRSRNDARHLPCKYVAVAEPSRTRPSSLSEGRTRTLRKSSNEDEQSGRPSLPYMFRLLQIPTVMILHPPQLFLRWIAAKLLLHVAHANIQLSFAQVDDCTTVHVVDRGIYEMKKRRLALAGSSAPMNGGLCSRSFSRRRRFVLLEVRRYWTFAVRVNGWGRYLWKRWIVCFRGFWQLAGGCTTSDTLHSRH